MPINTPPQDDETRRPPGAAKPTGAPEDTRGGAHEGGHEARDEEDSDQGLANRELDALTHIARPPLGN